MVYFNKNGGSRLAQIRALQENFLTIKESLKSPPAEGKVLDLQQQAFSDKSIMMQFAQVADSIKLVASIYNHGSLLSKARGKRNFCIRCTWLYLFRFSI